MIGIVTGKVTKTGTSQYGEWCIVAETVTKRDGDQFEKRYMCSGNHVPAEGSAVIVQGFAQAKTRDGNDGKTYADISLSACSFTTLGESESKPASKSGAPAPETFEEDIPFFYAPFNPERIEGHRRFGARRFTY